MKLNYGRTFFVGLAFLSICAFWQMYDTMIPRMLKNTFHMNETISGVIMAMDNVLALFLLPLFGTLSDKTKTRFGKRTPFIVIGTIFAVISMNILPIADKNANLTLFIISLGVVLLAMGAYRSPTVALMPDITPKPLRSKANAVINLMGALGALYTLLMILLITDDDDKSSDTRLFFAVSVVMLLSVVLLVVTVRERKLMHVIEAERTGAQAQEKSEEENKEFMGMPKAVRKSFLFILASIFLWFFAYNAVTTAYSRYAEAIWNMKSGGFALPLMVAMGAALLSYIPIGIIAGKIGRTNAIIIGIRLMTASYICGAFFNHYSVWINFIFIFTGIGWAAISVNSYPMVVEMCKGSDVGKYTGLYYMFSMSSQIITPIVSGALLQYVSYRTLFPYAAIFSLASLCTMLFVKHGDSRPDRKQDILESFDTQD
jgi:maltose/moltooligosaccharide transporter